MINALINEISPEINMSHCRSCFTGWYRMEEDDRRLNGKGIVFFKQHILLQSSEERIRKMKRLWIDDYCSVK